MHTVKKLSSILTALLAVSFCLGSAYSQTPSKKPAQPPEINDPVTKRPEPLPTIDLPAEDGFPAMEEIGQYENPLLLFQGNPNGLPMAEEIDPGMPPDLLPPLAPFPGDAPDKPMTPAELKLLSLGQKVVASVVSIRVWDEFGGQIAHGVGCFVTDDGVVLTDAGLVHPEIAGKIDRVTLTTADGTNQPVTGFYLADNATGVTLLQAETRSSKALRFKTEVNLAKETPCHVVAVSEKRGLVIAHAKIQKDSSVTALGWHPLRGDESPGAVGSPVLDDDGNIIAIVGMRVPLKSWMNFALKADQAAFEVQRRRSAFQPLANLPKAPTLVSVARSTEFLDAFQTLQARRVESALPKLIRLTAKYPRSAECWALLGLAASYLGGASEAVNCQRKAVALDPKAGLYWHQLAFAKLRDKSATAPNSEEDREALELATQQRPEDSLAWLLLASRHARDGNLGKAEDALNRVILLAPDFAQGHYLMAYVRGRLRDYDGAEQHIRRALNLNSRYPEAWYYQGLMFDKKGDFDAAAKAYQTTVRLRPNHPQAWMNLAHSLKKAGKTTEARQAFQEHQRRTTPRKP
jgi:tetratricopeptide (TPR) repeat protein